MLSIPSAGSLVPNCGWQEGAAHIMRKPLGFMQLSIIVGYSLFYALYLVTFFGLFASVPSGMDFTSCHVGQLVYFGASVVSMYAILAWFRKRDSSTLHLNRASFLVSLIAMGALLPACFVLQAVGMRVPLLAVYATCACSGVFTCFGFVLWDDLMVRGYMGGSGFLHSIVFAVGGVVFVACMLAGSQAVIGTLCLVFLLASAFLAAFITKRAEKSRDLPVQGAIEHFKRAFHLDVLTCATTLPFGFAFILLYDRLGAGIVAVMLLAVAIDFVLNMLIGAHRVIPFMGTLRTCMALSTVALLLFTVPSDPAKVVALGIVVCVWFVYRTVNGSSLMNLAASKKVSLQYCVGRGKLAGNIGFILGLAVGIATVQTLPAHPAASGYVALAIVACMVLAALFLLPFDNESEAPGIRTLVPIEKSDLEFPEEVDLARKCQALIDRYKLSPRESEVLGYIVKGRNARHVADRLCISESTAKTHISNIYRKTNVHSQQELLDIIEEL